MLVKKTWASKKTVGNAFKSPAYYYKGYFLLGLIPLYIERHSN